MSRVLRHAVSVLLPAVFLAGVSAGGEAAKAPDAIAPEAVTFYPKGGADAARAAVKDEVPALLIESNADEKKHGEFSIARGAPALARAEKTVVEVRIWVGDAPDISTLHLRLNDKDGEIFQYSAPVPATAKGWITLAYRVDPEKPPANTWGNKEKLNGVMDFPCRVNGFGFHYRKPHGNAVFALGAITVAAEGE